MLPMMHAITRSVGLAFALGASLPVSAQVRVESEFLGPTDAGPGFSFKTVARPARTDAGSNAVFTLVDGRSDPNGGDLKVLHDGLVPAEEDAPRDNFFFRAGTDGGRLQVDLGRAVAIQAVRSYSWHPGARGPQVYRLYASDGQAAGFDPQPKRGTDPAQCGWTSLANVDTRPKSGDGGGQHGVSISAAGGVLGTNRYLLFDILRTEDTDGFGNTFFSEIDVMDRDAPAPEFIAAAGGQGSRETVEIEGGKYSVSLDTTGTPDLAEWVREAIVPMVREWYPKMVKLLPSEGYEAPARFSILFDKGMQGVASTSGTRIRCAASWMRQNLKGEAVGAIFHEMVHVVQQYGRAPRSPGATRPPGWLTEGITDYLRWYLFEPQTHGAEITRRNLARARYDGSYRITANFLNWVSGKHGADFVPRLNSIIREGKYNEDTWKQLTGHTVQELGAEWKTGLEEKLGGEAPAVNGTPK
jgi:hypothetical protein